MYAFPQSALVVAAVITLVAALGHFACVFWGAPGFRFLGAGERLVKLAERGHWYPSVVACIVGSVLLVWSAYAFSAVGLIPGLPFARWVLAAISAVFLLRGVAFPLLKSHFRGNSHTFWIVSSTVSFVIGLLYLVGVVGMWESL